MTNKKLAEIRSGTKIKLGLSNYGNIDWKPNDAHTTTATLFTKNSSCYVAWEEQPETPYVFAIDSYTRKLCDIPDRYQWGTAISGVVEAEVFQSVAPSSLGFLFACMGAGVALSTIAKNIEPEKKETEHWMTMSL